MAATMVDLGGRGTGTMSGPAVLFDWDVWRIRDINALAVRFRLLHPARVTIRIAPLNGARAKTLYDAPRPAGEFSEGWRMLTPEGAPMPPGVYQVSLALDGEPVTDTLLIKD
jgi:hypothetical protein